jgi:hypothetical protein
LPEHDSVYARNKITIQNHSYGTTVQNYYGAEAGAYDGSTSNNRALLHIFSSGNSGAATTGTYAGDFGNLTGNFKMAKNAIVVGAIDSFYTVAPLSSKGPAYDGRVKPELVAFGEDGSSGAAAMVSGAGALLQQAYKDLHHDSLPSSSLMKAVLINGADDIGTPGPDFTAGYGSLNVHAAVNTVAQGRTHQDIISSGETKSVIINVPANTSRLKITLCWSDPPATPSADKALINNLDGVLKFSTGAEWHPWVLNTKRNRDSLTLPAIRGVDTLNNTEQITVDHPAAGAYTFIVTGSSVVGSQDYSFAYQLETANAFEWTFPTV